MLKTLKNLLRVPSPSTHLRSGSDPKHLAAEDRHFHPAVFAATGVLPDGALRFEVALRTMAIRNGVATVDACIDTDGLRVWAVVDGRMNRTDVYLGNYFWVPDALKRRGLATAALAAVVQTYEIARFGATDPARPLHLEGHFVGEGVAFATALCGGVRPTKGSPAAVDAQRLVQAARRLRIEVPPRPNVPSFA